MKSINLLPKIIRDKYLIKNMKAGIILISVGMIISSLFSYSILYMNNITVKGDSTDLDLRLDQFDKDIKAEIDNNKSLLIDNDIKISSTLLDDHRYYSNFMNGLQDLFNEDIYLTSGDISSRDNSKSINFAFTGSAKDYAAAIKQVSVFKSSYWVDNIDINSLSGEEDIDFSGSIDVKKEMALYQEKYWNFGLSILLLEPNRLLKIDTYSANIIDKNKEDVMYEAIFSGTTYSKKTLEKFISNLSGDLEISKKYIKSVDIKYDENIAEGDLIEFNGTMEYTL